MTYCSKVPCSVNFVVGLPLSSSHFNEGWKVKLWKGRTGKKVWIMHENCGPWLDANYQVSVFLKVWLARLRDVPFFVGKPHRRRQIVLIINRPARVWVVIHVNLCHILSHHFLAPCHKKEKHYQIKTRLKETFPLQIDIFAQFKQWRGRGGSIFRKELAEEMTSEASW